MFDLSSAIVAAARPLLGKVDLIPLLAASQGVVLVVVIILLTLIALTAFVIFYKLIHISQAQAQSIRFLDRFWESKRLDEIYKVAEKLKQSPIAAMFRAGYVELSKVKKRRDAQGGSMHDKMEDSDNVARALQRAQISEQTKLENLLPFLATTGSAAPFIGLFGTVWGIKNSFESIALTQNTNLAVVAPGIAEALIATALGLLAAIPAVIFYNKLSADADRLQARMENFADEFGTILNRQMEKLEG